MKQKKSSFEAGTIDKFKSALKYAIENKESFKTVSNGMSRSIVLNTGTKLKYFGTEKNHSRIAGAFLVPMVQREIDQYIEEHGVPSHYQVRDVQQFNLTRIRKLLSTKKKTPIIGLDINACYWNTAHQLGYISDKLYARGLEIAKKEGLLVAIGCLNKCPVTRTYINGKLSEKNTDDEHQRKYAPFYWNIIAKTNDLLLDSFERFGDDFYMFLTDCLFVDYSRMNEAKELIESYGYNCKSHQIEILSFDEYKLEWFDYKVQDKKQIFARGRDVRVSYDLNQISKGLNQQPLNLTNLQTR
jgi:hypothetical protein